MTDQMVLKTQQWLCLLYTSYRPLVYICSPYSGDVQANVELARQFCGLAVSAGKIPFAPHLLFPQFMDDADPDQRELAMFFNRVLLAKCEALWAYVGRVSPGTVSYTHLDVYKRQAQLDEISLSSRWAWIYTISEQEEDLLSQIQGIKFDTPITPVSYTHLDVYKRQAGCLALFANN